jgi:hypothetical protein
MKKLNGAAVLVVGLAFFAGSMLPGNIADAQGVVDQSNLAADGGAHQILGHMPIGQEFTPSRPTLVGVDIAIRSNEPIGGSDTITLNIRKGTISSPILASASRAVAYCPSASCIEHFDFPKLLFVSPGEKYVLEAQATNALHAWVESYDPSYPGGAAILQGVVYPDQDQAFQTYYQEILPVDVDIKPGSTTNPINCKNKNMLIPVAILTTASFDAVSIDPTTVRFAGASEFHMNKRTGEVKRHEVDVNGDGKLDLVFHFRLRDTSLTCASRQGTLIGETFDGQAIQGADRVHMLR